MARDRAGTLSVINMGFLFLAHHLGFLANAMGISLMTYIAVAAQPLLNSLLSDDILDDGYILEMSFFVASNQMIEHGKPFGQHRRATVFNGKPRYDEIISEEASGRNIKRLPNTHEDRGEYPHRMTYEIV
ncbi:hypothetical protein CBS147325_9981 [Penicillium roqueforti]|nr:hypothetical protein CBS147325_9981 [Penicillium roqueforti]KAI3149061.1 hypothetical protein DTO046C5_9715 [Penicillium roqueforti]